MSNFSEVPLGFRVLSTHPDLRIRFHHSIGSRILMGCFVLPFFVLFILHAAALLRAVHHAFNFQFEQALLALCYGANNFWAVLLFIFVFALLSIISWAGVWSLLGRTKLQAAHDSLVVVYKLLGFTVQKRISSHTIEYFNQFDNSNSVNDSWVLEAVTHEKRFQQDLEYPSWIPADTMTRSTYKTIHLYTSDNSDQTAWLGRVLAEFYGVEFRSVNQSNRSVAR